jgi:hypothetical protein
LIAGLPLMRRPAGEYGVGSLATASMASAC